jgi:hypothetical protein
MSQGKTLMEVFAAEEARSHGGARKGAGRKPTGSKFKRMGFTISLSNALYLAKVDNKSRFVNKAIELLAEVSSWAADGFHRVELDNLEAKGNPAGTQ